ncbi:LLM class flavin-dependent oxidoreductase [Rhodococcoides kyotonense]|uniref:Luciferase-like monooxygenase n=1 Tax=Rhodococcoides kyotonense TaxID=398843 RepID=A0A239GEI3_9NOCA|nr:LLM class flavin-dependent oxidoreductase [Rhodococcus kyotonensis]SNS67451.1 Luciferase-like monooxygenase [Rhodococcus kyotonensis]
MNIFAVGIELDGEGSHPQAWRRANHAPNQALSGKTLSRRVAAAENAGFTFATFDDSIVPPAGDIRARVDAVARASFVAATTSTIGLVPVVGTTYAEPFHTSSQLATLDYSSRGRAGWIPTRVSDPAAARAWGRPEVTTDANRDREQRDSISVARALWDSWEDDAVIRHYASGRFLDRDKLHYVDFEGESFTVKGPAIVPRPPQGQLVVFGTESERDLVDVVLVQQAPESRSEGLTFVEIDVTLDTASESAAERADGLGSAPASGRVAYSGSAAGFVDLLTELASTADGVRLFPTVVDEDVPVLSRYVLPELLQAGLAHRPVAGSTFRANLGLARPANRYERV